MFQPPEIIEEYYPEKGYASDHLILNEQFLAIHHKNKDYIFPVGEIQEIELKHIRLLFHYLVGAFTTVLSLLAILNYYLAPLPGILLILIGATLFFIGWKGKISLQLSTATDVFVFWFAGAYAPFLKFINTVRHHVITQQQATFFPPDDSNSTY